ncbi:c-type cytochrome [Endothiovibrio diazotrophicus]
MKKLIAISALAALSVTAGNAIAAGSASAGQTKAAVCAACHGADGNSVINPLWPSLAGQHASYIVKQLTELHAGDRKDPTMSPMAAPLSEADIADLAAWFSSQTRQPHQADPAKVKLGKQIYHGGNMETGVPACMACHGPTGAGNEPAKFPSLAGQNAAYTAKQLKAFRDGSRANDPNGMMRGTAKFMSDAEIDAVASYIQGLH